MPGFGSVDVNAVHPDVSLSALRIHRKARPAPQQGGGAPPPVVEPPTPGTGRTDLQEVRLALVTAARSIEAAVARLPER